MLQWIGCGVTGELGADLPDSVTQGDHVFEPLPNESVEVLRAGPGQVDTVFGHHRDRVLVYRLGVAARTTHLWSVAGQLPQ